MKKLLVTLFASVVATAPVSAETQDYQLLTVAGYLNFYLLNINACQDYHPVVRQEAYLAEAQLYPWLEKLEQKLGDNKATVAAVVQSRREALNQQIAEGEFSADHCRAVVKLLSGDGLDKTLLQILN
ncbi:MULTISPECIES: hypothetical protein [Rheinheimera]|uniref:Uncharacterized protein n=1 Tax=Rheinheimera marina TaxID=1774958 RepID=A0ABV9JQQ3_9GAMM